MKDRRYAITIISKAKIGDKNKTYPEVYYASSKKEAQRKIAEKVFNDMDVVGVSVTKIIRHNPDRYFELANMARNIFRRKNR